MQISVILSLQEWDVNGIMGWASVWDLLFRLYQSLTQAVHSISSLSIGQQCGEDTSQMCL